MFEIFHAPAMARARRTTAIGVVLIAVGAALPAMAQQMTLNEILSRAAANDPVVEGNAARIEVAQAGVRLAAIGPRPIIGIDAENFAGNDPYSPVDRAETTIYYERALERGGKRQARTNVARAEVELARRRGTVRMLDNLAQAQIGWTEALAAQAEISVAEERLDLARWREAGAAKRVGVALDPLFTKQNAHTAVVQARIDLDKAVENARLTRAALAARWGGSGDYVIDMTPFDRLDGSGKSIDEAPDIALVNAERDVAERRVGLQESNSFVDPSFRLGVRHLKEDDAFAVVVGASVPLGTARANRANVDRAQSERAAAQSDILASRAQAEREYAVLVSSRAMIAAQVQRIDGEVLPNAHKALALVRSGFSRGGTGFTHADVANAEAVIIDARLRRIELLRDYHLKGARMDRLTGRHLALATRAEDRR